MVKEEEEAGVVADLEWLVSGIGGAGAYEARGERPDGKAVCIFHAGAGGVQLLKIFTCYLWAAHAPGSERANSNSVVSRRGYFSLPFKNLVHAVLRRRRRRRMENLEARIYIYSG